MIFDRMESFIPGILFVIASCFSAVHGESGYTLARNSSVKRIDDSVDNL